MSKELLVYCQKVFSYNDSRLDNLDEVFTSFCRTPLHIAAMRGDIKFAKQILSLRPDLALKQDLNGFTPLHLASARFSIKMVQLLLRGNRGIDACIVQDQHGRTPLHLAAMQDRVRNMKVLMEECPEAIHLKNDQNETILHFCVKINTNISTLGLVIKKLVLAQPSDLNHISVNSRDNDGNTILHLAAETGNRKIVDYLLNNNNIRIDTNAVNNNNLKALSMLSPAQRDELEIGFYDNSLEQRAVKHEHKTNSKDGDIKHKKLKERTNTAMVVATLIAGIAFQAAMNPPGGVWQDDSKVDSGKDPITFTYYLNRMYGSTITCSLDSYLQEGCKRDGVSPNNGSYWVEKEKRYSGISFVAPNSTKNKATALDHARIFVYDLMSTIWWEESPSDLYMMTKGLILRDFNSTKVVSNYSSSDSESNGGNFFPYIMRYAGYPIMAYSHPAMYMIYMTSSGVAFFVSLCIILLATCGFINDTSPTQARFLGMLMCISILSVSHSYVCLIVTLLPGFYTERLEFLVFCSYTAVCCICGFCFYIWSLISKVVKLRKRHLFGINIRDAICVWALWDKDSMVVVIFAISTMFFVGFSLVLLYTSFMVTFFGSYFRDFQIIN